MQESQVATIALDGIDGRGAIHIKQEPATYYTDLQEADGLEWVISVQLPDGTIEDPAIAPQRNLKDAIRAISDAWQLGCWDLQFTT